MKFDTSIDTEKKRAETYFNSLLSKSKFIEVRNILPKRSNPQNAYLHLIIGWFGIEYGETIEHVKQVIFKQTVNPGIFKTEYTNKKTGEVRVEWKSTAELTTGEMTTAIEKFRKYSSEAGIYIPEPNEEQFLKHIESQLSSYKNYI